MGSPSPSFFKAYALYTLELTILDCGPQQLYSCFPSKRQTVWLVNVLHNEPCGANNSELQLSTIQFYALQNDNYVVNFIRKMSSCD